MINPYPYILFRFPVVNNLLADCPVSQLANLYWQLAKTSAEVASSLLYKDTLPDTIKCHLKIMFDSGGLLQIKVINIPRCYFYYRPRSWGDNTFGSVHLFVCMYPPISEHRVCISRSIQNGWVFEMVVVSTGCATMVDHAFNSHCYY